MYPRAILAALRMLSRFRLLNYSVTILLVIVANAIFMIQPLRAAIRKGERGEIRTLHRVTHFVRLFSFKLYVSILLIAKR